MMTSSLWTQGTSELLMHCTEVWQDTCRISLTLVTPFVIVWTQQSLRLTMMICFAPQSERGRDTLKVQSSISALVAWLQNTPKLRTSNPKCSLKSNPMKLRLQNTPKLRTSNPKWMVRLKSSPTKTELDSTPKPKYLKPLSLILCRWLLIKISI